jgi:signal transduction histidine kinase
MFDSNPSERQRDMPQPPGARWSLLKAPARLFGHFEEFHSFGPPRLKYIGWTGVAGYSLFYFIRFTRRTYSADDDLFLRLLVLFLFAGTALQGLWPEQRRRYYFCWAYVTLLVGLPYFAVYTGLERGGGIPAISNCFVATAVLALLVDWRNFIAMLLVGAGTAFLAFRLGHPEGTIPRELLAQIPAYLLIAITAYVFKYSTEQAELERALHDQQQENERRLAGLGDTLGFMAHELNTPLATIRTAASVVRARRLPDTASAAQFSQRKPGEIEAIVDRADRAAMYCQTLVASFVHSARTVAANKISFDGSARGLIASLLAEYPFAEHERAVVSTRVEQDFSIKGRRDLVYMVLCTVVNNALHAMRAVPQPELEIIAGVRRQDAKGDTRGWIRVRDTGSGIPEAVLAKLTVEPVTTKEAEGGTGMGLVFCRRVLESMGGNVAILSHVGEGTTVLLEFDTSREPA